jgi:AcrR family transcriptional regulator
VSTASSTDGRRAASDADTVSRILDGALRVAARKGIRKLSMSDVSESAGVSRGTLYRYFSSKEDVLTGMADHILSRWEQHVRAAVEAKPRRADRLRVVMDAIIGYAQTAPDSSEILRVDQEYGLALLQRNFPDTVRIVADFLEPVIEDAAVVQARVITGPELAEIMLRIAMAGFLVPATRTKQLGKRVANVWDFLNTAAMVDADTDDEAVTGKIADVSGMPGKRRRLGA